LEALQQHGAAAAVVAVAAADGGELGGGRHDALLVRAAGCDVIQHCAKGEEEGDVRMLLMRACGNTKQAVHCQKHGGAACGLQTSNTKPLPT
jgi:hypothetical protein